jgi:glycosyltransferase involved in cell wall biosynthesis
MRVSVIVPVYNGEHVLPDLLEALAAQTYPRALTEILVVDNNSVDQTKVAVERWSNRGVVYLACEKQGSYAARNVGIAHSTGEILAFTDADCRPEPDWLEAGVDEFRSNHIDRVAGVITVPLSTPPRLWELVDATTYIVGDSMAQDGLISTANLLIRRSAIDLAGNFDETVISGADMELGRRCNEHDVPFIFSRKVKVSHRSRGAMEQIRRSRRMGVGLAQVTREPTLVRVAKHWREVLPGTSMARINKADFDGTTISSWRWLQVRVMRYLAVDMVRSASHLWGRWILRHGRAEQILAEVSRSG